MIPRRVLSLILHPSRPSLFPTTSYTHSIRTIFPTPTASRQTMPPRRAASSAKRTRDSPTSSLSSPSPPPSPPAKKPRAKAPAKPKAEPKPKRTPKAKAWPPADLAPPYPKRQGFPAYTFSNTPAVTSLNGVNGGITPLDATEPLRIGAHVSMAGGPATALMRASMLGANGIALFVKGHRAWKAKDLGEDQIEQWKESWGSSEGGLGYDARDVLVHGNYLVNLGNPDEAKWATSYECFRDDIARCHQLGIKLYNWHPGSTVGACTKEKSFSLIAKAINQVHKDVPEVITVIENMANAGSNIIGTAFSDLASMIALVDDKTRVRVCIDTCHLFASGYDMRTRESYAATMAEFSSTVGFEYLAGVHLNDSKADLGGNKDLHENIGLGKIGLTGFRELVRDGRMQGIPMVLETPSGGGDEMEVWKEEIALLYEIQGVEDELWEVKKGEIETRWRAKRGVIAPAKEKKVKKGKKADSDDEE